MAESSYRYALHFFRPDGTRVAQVVLDGPLAIDWAPAEEWVRFQAWRGAADSSDAQAPVNVGPVWHASLGEPYVEAFDLRLGDEDTLERLESSYVRGLAERATSHLISRGLLNGGDRAVYVVTAFAQDLVPADEPTVSIEADDVSTLPQATAGSVAALDARSNVRVDVDRRDFPVFVPQQVLDEASELARGAGDAETGGILIGHLRRDVATRTVFAEVTAQIAARHTTATASRLTFTRETWTAVTAALALRRSGETMLGWWHSHPVRVWCAKCPPERQVECTLAQGFFSEHDRALHRTVFPRAYAVGLLVNDRADGATFSMFGWRRGRLEARGFSVLDGRADTVLTGRPMESSAPYEGKEETCHEHAATGS